MCVLVWSSGYNYRIGVLTVLFRDDTKQLIYVHLFAHEQTLLHMNKHYPRGNHLASSKIQDTRYFIVLLCIQLYTYKTKYTRT